MINCHRLNLRDALINGLHELVLGWGWGGILLNYRINLAEITTADAWIARSFLILDRVKKTRNIVLVNFYPTDNLETKV